MTSLPAEFAPFFAHAREGRLCLPKCRACDRFHWYPMPRCPHCQAAGWIWQRINGAGEIYSLTTVHHAFDRDRRDELPFVVALVTLAEAPGVRLITNIVATDGKALRVGQRVEPNLPMADDDRNRITFRLAAEEGSERS